MAQKQVSKRDEHPLASAIFTGIGIAIMGGALNYGFGSFDDPGVGFLSFWAGFSITFFSTITLIGILKHKWTPLKDLWEMVEWRRPAIVMASLIVYSTFLRDIGFLPLSFILMILLLRLSDPPTWKVTFFGASITVLAFYLVFQIWLEAQLPRGILGF